MQAYVSFPLPVPLLCQYIVVSPFLTTMELKEGGEHNRPGQHAAGHRRKRCSSSSWKQNVCRSEKSGCGRGAGLLGRPTARAACLACMGLPSQVFVCPPSGGLLRCTGMQRPGPSPGLLGCCMYIAYNHHGMQAPLRGPV